MLLNGNGYPVGPEGRCVGGYPGLAEPTSAGVHAVPVTVSPMKDPAPAVTASAAHASALAARVLADGLDAVADSVAHVLHGASEAARDRAQRGASRSIEDGRATRWTGHKAARREELIDSAVEAIARYGADISMDQVASVAGTSKPVIYRYFADKDDLCRAVSQRLVAAGLTGLLTATAAAHGLREVIGAGVNAYLQLLEAEPEQFRFINRHPLIVDGDSGALVDFSSVVAELLAQRLRAALEDAGMDPSAAHPWAEGTVGFIRAASAWWLEQPDARSRDELSEQLLALLWNGAGGVLAAGMVPDRPDDEGVPR